MLLRRKMLKLFSVLLTICAIAILLVFISKATTSTPEKTASAFYAAIEKQDEQALMNTLSPDPLDAPWLHVTLSPDINMELEMHIRKDSTARIKKSLERFVSNIPGVLSVTYIPERKNLAIWTKNISWSGIVRIVVNRPADILVLLRMLENRPEVDRMNGSRIPRFYVPLKRSARHFLASIPNRLRFRKITYGKVIEGHLALVNVASGIAEKTGTSGETLPVSLKEFGQIGTIPSAFLLRKMKGAWKIISFPNL